MTQILSEAKGLCLTILLSLFFLTSSLSSTAQLNFEFTEGKYMIKGKISDLKSEEVIPFANVLVTNQKKGVTAEQDGKFTLYVYPTDTLRFSALGYIPKTIPVNAISENEKYTFTIQLVPDIYSLNTVTIYPFHDRAEFIEQFIKGTGVQKPIVVAGMEAPKYIHKEKARFTNPISAIYNNIQKKKRAADPDFKP